MKRLHVGLGLTRASRLAVIAALMTQLAACTMPKKAERPEDLDAATGGIASAVPAPLPPTPSAPVPMRPATPPEPLATVVVPPQPRIHPAPEYPAALSEQGIEGQVTVRFMVDAQGQVRDLKVVRSPHPQLSKAVQAALSRWRFQPGRDAAGQAVAAPAQQSFSFRAEN